MNTSIADTITVPCHLQFGSFLFSPSTLSVCWSVCVLTALNSVCMSKLHTFPRWLATRRCMCARARPFTWRKTLFGTTAIRRNRSRPQQCHLFNRVLSHLWWAFSTLTMAATGQWPHAEHFHVVAWPFAYCIDSWTEWSAFGAIRCRPRVCVVWVWPSATVTMTIRYCYSFIQNQYFFFLFRMTFETFE